MDIEEVPAYQHSLRIWKVIPPILLLFGTFGNVLTIVVLTRRRSKNSSTAVFLSALATSDLLVLYSGLLRQWINYLFEIDVRTLTTVGCKINVFIVYVCTQVSSWLLVAVTLERSMSVCFPHKARNGCNQRSAGIVVAAICAFFCLLNSHWFYGVGNYETENGNETIIHECESLFDHYGTFLDYTWPWIDLCFFSLFPFIILMVGNISIIVKVLISKQKSKCKVAPANASSNTTKKDDKTSQLTGMLILLNTFFLVCVTPICIFLIGEPYWKEQIETVEDSAVLSLWWAVTNVFMYLNHAMNFVLYFLSGSRFRNEVKALFMGGRVRALFNTVTGGAEMTSRVGPSAHRYGTQNTCLDDSKDGGRTTNIKTISE